MADREMVVAGAGVEVFQPAGAVAFTDAEIDELTYAVDGLDLRSIMRAWLDDHAPALAALVFIRDAV